MEAPLTGNRPDVEGEGDSAAAPQPLPESLRTDLRRLIGLALGGPSRWQQAADAEKAGLWLSLALLHWIGVAYVCYRAISAVERLEAVAVVVVAFFVGGPGLLLTVSRLATWRGMMCEGYLDSVLDAPVSATAATTAAQLLKRTRRTVLFSLPAVLSIWASVASAVPERALPDYVAAALALGLAPVANLQDFGMLLAHNVAWLLTAERIQQLATEVKQRTAATADFDGLATGALRAHEDTARLSSLMQVPVLATVCRFSLGALVTLALALGPQPPEDASFGIRLFINPYLNLPMSTLLAGLAIRQLAGPAQATAACQSFASAVNDLRATKQPDGSAVLATPEQAVRIECLKRYINELNNDQGMVSNRVWLGPSFALSPIVGRCSPRGSSYWASASPARWCQFACS
eukprot:SAG11_NODE_2008_length_3927_cov_7.898903_4_plen_405_part_00